MKKSLLSIVALLALLSLAACGGGAFRISGKLSDAGTQNLRIVYLSGDSIVSQWVPAVGGEFKFDGKVNDLSVVYLYSAQMQLIAHVAVDSGDDISLEGSIADCYNVKVTGSDVNEQWNKFIRDHAADFKAMRADKTDCAIADFVEKNPDNVVSTLLLTCDYTDITGAEAQRLMKKISKQAKPEQLLSLYASFFNGNNLSSKKIDALKLRDGSDSIVLVRTYDHPASVIFFWRANDSGRQSIVGELRSLQKDTRLQVVDICLDSDTISWRRIIDGDSVRWGHYKAIGGVVDQTVSSLNVKGSPYFIVADSTGTQIYRGKKIDDVKSVLKKKKLK